MKKLFVLIAVIGFVVGHTEDSDHGHEDVVHEDLDVTTTRIKLPYDSYIFIKKRLSHGNIYTTEMSDPNLLFLSEIIEENFQYFELSCNVCSPGQELMLILHEKVDQLTYGGPEPEIRAYNVYIV